MIRSAIIILIVLVAFTLSIAASGEPGQASMLWLGWRIDTSAAAALLLIGVISLISVLFWRLVAYIAAAPQRAARAQAEIRRRQGHDILIKGFLAAASGDGSEARRCAQKALDLVEDAPALARILAAHAAEAAKDTTAAKAAYGAMLGFADMRLVGLKGLMQTALKDGDKAGALKYAAEAYNQARTARWAWRALFEAKLEAGEWSEALELVEGALNRKIVTPLVAERARSALLAASAAVLETHQDDQKTLQQAADYAVRAAKLKPDFTPGVVIAARCLAQLDRTSRAEELIETAFAAKPHPALWITYRDLITSETPRERVNRLQILIDKRPEDREARILDLERALIGGERNQILKTSERLLEEKPTRRLCGLQARAALALGRNDDARAWHARGRAAALEADWSDIHPDGRAFAYGPGDWSRLVGAYAETGDLIHPRFERGEAGPSDLPDVPAQVGGGFETSAAFIHAAESATGLSPLPDDPGGFDPMLLGDVYDMSLDEDLSEAMGYAPEPAPKPAPRRTPRGGSKSGRTKT